MVFLSYRYTPNLSSILQLIFELTACLEKKLMRTFSGKTWMKFFFDEDFNWKV